MTHRSIDRSIDQSINRSIERSNDRTIDRTIERSIDRSRAVTPSTTISQHRAPPILQPRRTPYWAGLPCDAGVALRCLHKHTLHCGVARSSRFSRGVAWLGVAWRANAHFFARKRANARAFKNKRTNERTNATAQNNANDKCELHYCTVPKLNFQYTVKRPK